MLDPVGIIGHVRTDIFWILPSCLEHNVPILVKVVETHLHCFLVQPVTPAVGGSPEAGTCPAIFCCVGLPDFPASQVPSISHVWPSLAVSGRCRYPWCESLCAPPIVACSRQVLEVHVGEVRVAWPHVFGRQPEVMLLARRGMSRHQ